MESEWKIGKMEGVEKSIERGEGQVVINVLLFTAGCLQYGCVRAYMWELWLWVICETA